MIMSCNIFREHYQICYAITRFIVHSNDLLCNYPIYYAFKLFIILLSALLGIYMFYYAITRITVHLNDLLCNYLICYAIKIISCAPK